MIDYEVLNSSWMWPDAPITAAAKSGTAQLIEGIDQSILGGKSMERITNASMTPETEVAGLAKQGVEITRRSSDGKIIVWRNTAPLDVASKWEIIAVHPRSSR